jgi:hypothetical protein
MHFGRSQEAVTEVLYRKPIYRSKALKQKERQWDTRFIRRIEGGNANANKIVSFDSLHRMPALHLISSLCSAGFLLGTQLLL